MNIKQELNALITATKEEYDAVSKLENKDIIDRIEEERLHGRNIAYQIALSYMDRKLYSLAESESRCKSTTETYKESRKSVLYGDGTLLELAFFKGQAEGFAEVHALLEAEESNR